ncbi:hypothetical protein [Paenibacillus hunanensis]|uniref:RNase P/RNase MRP subunit p29 n=1 Tax=Paenibacillus hunanensis TaxID=539262 RepID=A0ABU1J316_9BACL|nr:hypothetical protein [Paenibacillus hunanensis]MCL9660760.1 hypothetical protein [Paenibacillus hunanensis]MDR6245894.1 RNase P/RNase MRP subunit p29 [Paenibacillus hunanensis]GGJ14316.1 hypothetical protein GCM10008022_24120 [Paenibacillus hunanensis]
MKNRLWMGTAAAVLLSGVIAGCGDTNNKEASQSGDPTAPLQSASEATPEDTGQANTNAQTLEGDFRQYSTDPNKSDSSSDYNVVGKYVSENGDTMTLDVGGNQLVIPKSNSYEPAAGLPTSVDLPGQEVSVTLNAQDSTIATAQLAKDADDMDNSQRDIVGQFVSETDTEVVIKQGTDEKKYKKAANFEGTDGPANERKAGTTVRVDLDKDGNVVRVRGEYQDGSSVGD